MLLVRQNSPTTRARRSAMQVRTDSKNGAAVASPSDTIEAFGGQTQSCIEQWIQQLQNDPDGFVDMEQQIDQHYRQGGGQLGSIWVYRGFPRIRQLVRRLRRPMSVFPLKVMSYWILRSFRRFWSALLSMKQDAILASQRRSTHGKPRWTSNCAIYFGCFQDFSLLWHEFC